MSYSESFLGRPLFGVVFIFWLSQFLGSSSFLGYHDFCDCFFGGCDLIFFWALFIFWVVLIFLLGFFGGVIIIIGVVFIFGCLNLGGNLALLCLLSYLGCPHY